MSERYGKTRVAKIKAAYDDLREAVRAHDTEAAEAALDRYEQWADYVFQISKSEAERDEERVRSHREGYSQGKSAGDAFAESVRQHVLKLEAEVERLREQYELDRGTVKSAANDASKAEGEVSGLQHALEMAWASNRERQDHIDALIDALTPSSETKAAYMGEFYFPLTGTDESGNEVTVLVGVPWAAIKDIMAAIRAHAYPKRQTGT